MIQQVSISPRDFLTAVRFRERRRAAFPMVERQLWAALVPADKGLVLIDPHHLDWSAPAWQQSRSAALTHREVQDLRTYE